MPKIGPASVAGVELAGRKVLEIGCGRGGNCSYLARYNTCLTRARWYLKGSSPACKHTLEVAGAWQQLGDELRSRAP